MPQENNLIFKNVVNGILAIFYCLLLAGLTAFILSDSTMFQLNFEKMFAQMGLFEITPFRAKLLNFCSNIYYAVNLAFSAAMTIVLAIPILHKQSRTLAKTMMILISAIGFFFIGFYGIYPEMGTVIKRAVDTAPERDALSWFYVVVAIVFAGGLIYKAYKGYTKGEIRKLPSWLAMCLSILIFVIAVKVAIMITQIEMLWGQFFSQIDVESLVLNEMERSSHPGDIVHTTIKVLNAWPTFLVYLFAFFVTWIALPLTSTLVADNNCRKYMVITECLWGFSMIASAGAFPEGDLVANYPALCWALGVGALLMGIWSFIIWRKAGCH